MKTMKTMMLVLIVLLSGCTSFQDRAQRNRHERLTRLQISDRSGMSFEQMLIHLSRCRRAFNLFAHERKDPLVKVYLKNVLKDVLRMSSWSSTDRDRIRYGKIAIGFTEQQVIASWGRPDRTYTTTTKHGHNHYLVYASNYAINGTVLIRKDKVVVISN